MTKAAESAMKLGVRIPLDLIDRFVSRWSDYDRLTKAADRTPDHQHLAGIAQYFRKLLREHGGRDLSTAIEVSGSEGGWRTLERFCFGETLKAVNACREAGALADLGALIVPVLTREDSKNERRPQPQKSMPKESRP